MPPPPLLSHPHFLPDALFAALLISLSLDISVTLRMPVSLPSPSRSLLFFTLVSTCLSFLPVDLREVPPCVAKKSRKVTVVLLLQQGPLTGRAKKPC